MTHYEESIELSASPADVFTVVTDLTGMGRFSPEDEGGAWLGGATTAQLGARFRGRNRNGKKEWTTLATVVRYEAPTHFSFKVTYLGIPVSTWTYALEPHDGGTRLTEGSTDERPRWFALVTRGIRANRTAFTERSVHATLLALRDHFAA